MTLWLALLQTAWSGDFTGRVVDDSDQGLGDATVVAYDQRFSFAIATTAPDGSFALTGLPRNSYRVRILPPLEVNRVERYLPDAFEICDGQVFALKRNGVIALGDTALEVGGQVSGWLVDSTGAPVADALLASQSSATDASQPRYANSDALGRWTISGLSLDSGTQYRVVVEVEGWPNQYLAISPDQPGVYDGEEAEAVSFTTLETAHVELGVRTLMDGIAVSGSALGPDGPINEGEAYIYSAAQMVETPIELGSWAVSGLPPGEVLAWTEVPGLATTYFPDSDRPAERFAVLTEGAVVDGIVLDMPAESRITGRLAAEGDLSTISLLAYNDDRTVAMAAEVASDGSFEIGRLHEGDYTLQVFGESAGLLNDELRADDGDPWVFSVPSGSTLDVGDLDVPLGAVIEGIAVDAYSGARIYGGFVYAESEEAHTIVLSATDDKGRYAIGGLPSGAYRIWADYQHYCDGDVDWVPRYWPDIVNPVLNGSVRVQAGETLVWNPTLPPDGDHDLMDDLWEREKGLDPRRDDAAEDPDDDGFSNLEEYQLGTDPLDGSRGATCGCGGDRSVLFGLVLIPLSWRRRNGDFSISS